MFIGFIIGLIRIVKLENIQVKFKTESFIFLILNVFFYVIFNFIRNNYINNCVKIKIFYGISQLES